MPINDDATREALDAVADAVRSAREASGEAPTMDKPEAIEDFGKLSAEPLLKFCEAAAIHIEQCGQEVLTEGQKLSDDCLRLAGEIRQVAKQQAEAIRAQTNRTRKAANAMTAVRDEFRADVTREVEAVEAARKLATEKEAKAS